MSEIDISYKGSSIATMDASGTKTLLTSGKYCEDDIEVVYTRPSAPTPSLQSKSKTYTPTTSTQTETVRADAGYDGLDAVNITVNAMSSGSATTPATTITTTPSISVSSSGLITATNSKTQSVTPTVSAGYVSSGTAGTITVSGSNTKQLTTKGYQLITPTTSQQTLATADTYLTGAQVVKGDANLVAGNIANGVTIFGVTGTLPNLVRTGTFTTGSSNGATNITISYNGSGYPVAVLVYVSGGTYNPNSSAYTTVKRYAVVSWTMTKATATSAPVYGTTTGNAANMGVVNAVYKNSTSDATVYATSVNTAVNSFLNSNATNAYYTAVRMKSNTTLSYYVIGSSSYGLLPSTTYRYIVLYSA